MKHTISSLILAAAALGACESTAGMDKAAATTEPDPRQGEQVKSLCFTGSINGWSEAPHLDDAVILTKGVRDKYLVTTRGVCDIDQAFINIGLETGLGSSCLRRGDKIHTDSDFIPGACYVDQIFEWNEDAGDDTSDDET